MQPTPSGWPRLASALFYADANAAIDWLCRAFGFEVRLKVEGDGGIVVHSELVFGEAVVMAATAGERKEGRDTSHCRSPRSVGGANTQSLMLYVDDVDAHCARARGAGGTIVSEPKTTDYGEEYWSDRGYEVVDLEGHHWWFCQRMRSPAPKSS